MNQKLRRVFFAGLGTACALILTDPVTASAGTWSNQDGPNQWKYFTDDTNYAADGWYWIDGDQDGLEECYYFDQDGMMLADTQTPDGYEVNADGLWTVSGLVQKREATVQKLSAGLNEQGDELVYCDESGELALNAWRNADGNWYYFDADGHAVKNWQYIDGFKFYFDENTHVMAQSLDGILSAPSFQIVVDRARCQVTVYAPDGDNGYIIPYRTFICSPGKSKTPTPLGIFHTTNKYRWHAFGATTFAQYCTRLGNTHILFHSMPGKGTTIYNVPAVEYNKLGEPASHGCIRMTVAGAKWLYDHCVSDTTVTVGDNLPAPFDKPAAIKIPETQNWDPTDPEVGQ